MKKIHYLWLAFMALLLLAACSPTGNASESETADTAVMAEKDNSEQMSDDTMMDEKDDMMAEEAAPEHDTMMDEEKPESEAMAEDDSMAEGEAMMEDKEGSEEAMADDEMAGSDMMTDLPTWQKIALTDVRSGESFTLADFAGKTVFVEPMATWCTNCRRQLTNVSQARAQLNDENVVFIALSVETNISNQDLANYAEQAGFEWAFAVASPELLQELAATFGQSITNPPSTPHFIIRPDGTYTDLVTGIESSEQLINQLQAAQG